MFKQEVRVITTAGIFDCEEDFIKAYDVVMWTTGAGTFVSVETKLDARKLLKNIFGKKESRKAESVAWVTADWDRFISQVDYALEMQALHNHMKHYKEA